MTKFKIFFSWQSDLPRSKTRDFIRDCIDDAIAYAGESEAIDAIRDEATKDTTGSPNIVTTLFSKIDDCDLFIADVSLCFTVDIDKDGVRKKHSPNPNVLLELGYAARTLGWEKVICLCNTDFGTDFPFDISQNRRTPFSLDKEDRKVVKRKIVKIIFSLIQTLKGEIPRASKEVAIHIIGSYDFKQRKVTGVLVPIELEKQESYILHNEELIEDSKKLVEDINALPLRINQDKKKQVVLDEIITQDNLGKANNEELIKSSLTVSTNSVAIREQEETIERIKRFLKMDISDEFFNLGDLSKTNYFMGHSVLNGSEEEKTKYKKIKKLQHKLRQLYVRQLYLQTFNGMYYIPLAIQNNSLIQDTDIRIVVTVKEGKIVKPNSDLICEELEGSQRSLCSDEDEPGIISELFELSTDENIHIEELPYNPSRYLPQTPILTINGLQAPAKTEEDYKNELEEYIADGQGFYEFKVKSLRPKECKWLSTGMLIKPQDGKISIEYRIHSAHSSGELMGGLDYICKSRRSSRVRPL